MKQILCIFIFILIVACGGGEKKAQEINPSSAPTYTFQTPTQDMLDKGKTIFNTSCFICHNDGGGKVMMLTDKANWFEDRAKDIETLVRRVHDGYTGNYGTMTPKGSCMECTKDDLRDAIYYMMTAAGVLE